jgi:hypothetical protein
LVSVVFISPIPFLSLPQRLTPDESFDVGVHRNRELQSQDWILRQLITAHFLYFSDLDKKLLFLTCTVFVCPGLNPLAEQSAFHPSLRY